MTKEQLKETEWYAFGLQPNGWWAFAYFWEGEIWVRVGCRTKSLADGRAYWADKPDRREVMLALDYAEIVAKRMRGWGNL